MNKEVEVEHVGAGFVRKTIACHISKVELVRGDPRAYEELITKKLEKEAGLESHYNKPFVARQAHYIPDAEVYRVSLTWFEFENTSKDQLASSLIDSIPDDAAYRDSLTRFEFENRSQVRMASNLNENFQQNSQDIPEEMEPPC